MGLGNFADISMGIDAQYRRIKFFTIPGKPVLYVATLIGVENQDIGLGNRFDSLVYPAEGSHSF